MQAGPYYEKDANTFADWGVDYVKIDWCGSNRSVEGHKNMSIALNKTGRHTAPLVPKTDPSLGRVPCDDLRRS